MAKIFEDTHGQIFVLLVEHTLHHKVTVPVVQFVVVKFVALRVGRNQERFGQTDKAFIVFWMVPLQLRPVGGNIIAGNSNIICREIGILSIGQKLGFAFSSNTGNTFSFI